MLIKKSKIYISPDVFYTVEEIRLNYHNEYLVCKNGEKNENGEYFKTLQEALQYITNTCNW